MGARCGGALWGRHGVDSATWRQKLKIQGHIGLLNF